MSKFSPIDYNLMRTCPAPWSSVDDGELWLADRYFMILQKYPLSILCAEGEDADTASPYSMPIIYPWALLVYHKIDEEHPDPLPFMVITLEISNWDNEVFRDISRKLAEQSPHSEKLQGMGPLFFCMFQNGKHYNFGPHRGGMDRESTRSLFFNKLASSLGHDLRVERGGTMLDAFGNPATGLLAR